MPEKRKGVFGAPLRPPLQAPAPSWRDSVSQAISAAAGKVGINERKAYQATRKALSVADFLPVIGDAAGYADAGNSFSAGKYLKGAGQAGLATVGLVPGVGDAAAAGGKMLVGALGAAGKKAAGKRMVADALPSPSTLNIPRAPTAAEMRAASAVQRVPMGQVRAGNKLQWDRFNKGDYGEPLVKGYADRPVAVQLENGEHILLDGNHRAALARQQGAQDMEMYVIPAKKYDPANAGKAPAKHKQSDIDLLSELFG